MKRVLDIYITTYNRLDMLYKAINSVLSQTYKEFNLIILDNASTVDVKTLVSSFNSPECIDTTCGIVVDTNNIIGLVDNIKYVCEKEPFSTEACIARAKMYDS